VGGLLLVAVASGQEAAEGVASDVPGARGEAPTTDAAPGELWRRCGDAVPWFVRTEVPNTEARMLELVTSGTLAAYSREWIGAAWEEAGPVELWLEESRRRGKPVFWYVPTIEGQHVILPHLGDRYVEVGLLSDPLMSELVARRFVPVKCPGGGEAAERFGLRPPDFVEPGFLVLSEEGEVLWRSDRVFTFQPAPHLDALRELLAELGGLALPSDSFRSARRSWNERPGVETGLACAEEALLDGALEECESLLQAVRELAGGDRPELLAVELRLARARRDRATAERLCARLGEDDGDLARDLRVERGLVRLGTGDLAGAEEDLAASFAAGGPRAAESGYHLGALYYMTRREGRARAAWGSVVAGHPASIWAARADACRSVGADGLLGEGPLTRSMESLDWIPPREETGPLVGTVWPRTSEERDDVVARGVRFLLAQQRSNGSWLGSRWGGDGSSPPPTELVGEGPGTFANIHTAISALSGLALLEWRDVAPAEIDAALERAEPYLLREDLVLRLDMAVAWVYADAFRLLYFARRYPDPAARPDEVEEALARYVEELGSHQEATGGPFKHYSYTSTFVTAMVTIGLLEAAEVGVEVPAEMLDRAAEVIESARGGELGLFGYLLDAPGLNRTIAGAACRQPLCTWVLLRCGRTDADDVESAVGLFLEHYARFIEPPRKSNFHMPELDGSAGYFFFHNLLATTMALADCGERRDEFATRLRGLICELPEVDGSFVDSGFSYGKSYGTAAALAALAELER